MHFLLDTVCRHTHTSFYARFLQCLLEVELFNSVKLITEWYAVTSALGLRKAGLWPKVKGQWPDLLGQLGGTLRVE